MGKVRNTKGETVLFDVLYEDGTRTSNRRVPGMALGGPDGDEGARSVLEDQDRRVGEASGVARPRIKSLKRVKTR